MFSEENRPTSALPLLGSKRQSLRCHWRVQEGVGGERAHVLFSDNHECSLFHLAFNFHQHKLFTKTNAGYNKGPSQFYLWVLRLNNTVLTLHSLLLCGQLQRVVVSCFLLI